MDAILLSKCAKNCTLPANGDTTAMCAILKHYEGYIAKLCTRTLKDDAGNTYSYVDEEMRNRLQVRLITRTLAFHVG
ncbi:helix-turn-helix domain-containing protein [Rubneribacter badeniensis]|uniref:Helix-turn-helix domain-containing protein n=1 Tax=Rubneribacter badeniensis TaxID=2070688 RepID=A0A2K2U1J6_9ACTN|nr:helix-turn-helix domain-containing protein [Rubneribacter badeniensis]